MKKLLVLTTALIAISAAPVFAADTKAAAKPEAKVMKGRMFKEADTNGDGDISKEEFMASSEKRFASLDTNGDGKITADEITAKQAQWKEKMKELRAQKKGAAEKPAETPAETPKAE